MSGLTEEGQIVLSLSCHLDLLPCCFLPPWPALKSSNLAGSENKLSITSLLVHCASVLDVQKAKLLAQKQYVLDVIGERNSFFHYQAALHLEWMHSRKKKPFCMFSTEIRYAGSLQSTVPDMQEHFPALSTQKLIRLAEQPGIIPFLNHQPAVFLASNSFY